MKFEGLMQEIERLPEMEGKTPNEAVGALASPGPPAPVFRAEERLGRWQDWGLWAEDEDGRIETLRPTRQLLEKPEAFDLDVVAFLGGTIDDLWARRALLDAGQVLVDSLAGDVLSTGPVDYLADDVLPRQFEPLADRFLALRFYGAAVSLMTNLSAGRPASSLAEEICGVELLELADDILHIQQENGVISQEEYERARGETRNLFDIFGDEDVLGMFDAEESPFAPGKEQQQAIQSLFEPLWGDPVTGYLGRRGP